MTDSALCACGAPLDERDRQIRFRLPDPVLALDPAELEAGRWGNDVMMAVENVGAFVRCLLPVRLSHGFSATFALWLGVHPADLQAAYDVWTAPEYIDLELSGFVANAIEPWGADLLAAPARAVVKDPEHVPYIVESSHDLLAQVITEEWPHHEVIR
ncbi:DUF2199 domain-containing protein [Nonomuraea aridisoli]|uniref:DUF2199 domain-containing protein n=1 Tax=Nonomuraea aridisoli TaxID=2070368 RepID=A0A2W2G2Q4_9ACTN|nr:DUF2199 domain-containing protein [Nonomuraea aridisoli]PZG21194.1 hypothetical protein C1J01_06950 [Nonomuraea aridisoli]